MHCVACSGTLSAKVQILRVIVPFLRRSHLCKKAVLNHKAMLAGQRSSQGLLQWSRLGERCTPGQGAPGSQVPCCAPTRVPRVLFGAWSVLAFL